MPRLAAKMTEHRGLRERHTSFKAFYPKPNALFNDYADGHEATIKASRH